MSLAGTGLKRKRPPDPTIGQDGRPTTKRVATGMTLQARVAPANVTSVRATPRGPRADALSLAMASSFMGEEPGMFGGRDDQAEERLRLERKARVRWAIHQPLDAVPCWCGDLTDLVLAYAYGPERRTGLFLVPPDELKQRPFVPTCKMSIDERTLETDAPSASFVTKLPPPPGPDSEPLQYHTFRMRIDGRNVVDVVFRTKCSIRYGFELDDQPFDPPPDVEAGDLMPGEEPEFRRLSQEQLSKQPFRPLSSVRLRQQLYEFELPVASSSGDNRFFGPRRIRYNRRIVYLMRYRSTWDLTTFPPRLDGKPCHLTF